VIAAHSQGFSLHLSLFYPDHEPREQDPHYPFFRAARRRIQAAGRLHCVIPGCHLAGAIELHHSKVEFALQNGIDVPEFNRLYGLHLDAASFLEWIEGEGNLEPLCVSHHRGALGVHCMPEPAWVAMRAWRQDLAPPARVVPRA
jgi:hypothetical protein